MDAATLDRLVGKAKCRVFGWEDAANEPQRNVLVVLIEGFDHPDATLVLVRVDAPSKHPDRLRDQRGLDPIADSVPLSIHRRDSIVREWCPVLSFNIRLCSCGPGRWSRSGRIIADVDEVVQHASLSVDSPPP